MSRQENLPREVDMVLKEEVEVLSAKESLVRRWLFESPALGRGLKDLQAYDKSEDSSAQLAIEEKTASNKDVSDEFKRK